MRAGAGYTGSFRRGFASALIFASDFPDNGLLPTRHRQRFGNAFQQYLPVRVALVGLVSILLLDEALSALVALVRAVLRVEL